MQTNKLNQKMECSAIKYVVSSGVEEKISPFSALKEGAKLLESEKIKNTIATFQWLSRENQGVSSYA